MAKQALSAYRIARLTAPCPSHKIFNILLMPPALKLPQMQMGNAIDLSVHSYRRANTVKPFVHGNKLINRQSSCIMKICMTSFRFARLDQGLAHCWCKPIIAVEPPGRVTSPQQPPPFNSQFLISPKCSFTINLTSPKWSPPTKTLFCCPMAGCCKEVA